MSDQSPEPSGVITVMADRPKRSESIGKIGAALAKAQGEMLNAEKDVKGNYGKYATLASTWDAIRKPLSNNEIAVYQRPLVVNKVLKMCTMLIHSSGEFIDDSELEMIFDRSGGRLNPMQAMGSAVTYARRYTLQAATGIAPQDDDDGNGAGKPQDTPPPSPKQEKKAEAAKMNAGQAPQTASKSNFAPASKQVIEQINGLCMDRGISEGELNYLITKGYGCTPGSVPTWIAKEMIDLLNSTDTNSGTIMAQAQRVISRREAAKITNQSGGQP